MIISTIVFITILSGGFVAGTRAGITALQMDIKINELSREILENALAQDNCDLDLLTTAAGLVVAIPCLAGFYLLNNRGDYLIDKMEEKSVSMANWSSSRDSVSRRAC